jgi:hypothetical protein
MNYSWKYNDFIIWIWISNYYMKWTMNRLVDSYNSYRSPREPHEDYFQLGRSWWDQRKTKGLNAVCGESSYIWSAFVVVWSRVIFGLWAEVGIMDEKQVVESQLKIRFWAWSLGHSPQRRTLCRFGIAEEFGFRQNKRCRAIISPD